MNGVRVGQLWADNDRRESHVNRRQRLRVVKVVDDYARLRDEETGHEGQVLLRRMRPTSTGYRLVEDLIPPERQVRRAGDPKPCESCGGGRCRMCRGFGMVSSTESAAHGVTYTAAPCPHGCAMALSYYGHTRD